MVQLADWVDVSPMTCPAADDVFTALRDAKAAPTGWVLVLESNGHVAHVNSEALARAGVDRDTPDPTNGRYVRDDRGELTGRHEESSAVAAVTIEFPMVTGDALVGRIRDLLCHAAGKV